MRVKPSQTKKTRKRKTRVAMIATKRQVPEHPPDLLKDLISQSLVRDPAQTLHRDQSPVQNPDLNQDLDRDQALDLDHGQNLLPERVLVLNLGLDLDQNLHLDLDRHLNHHQDLNQGPGLKVNHRVGRHQNLDQGHPLNLNPNQNLLRGLGLGQSLAQLPALVIQITSYEDRFRRSYILLNSGPNPMGFGVFSESMRYTLLIKENYACLSFGEGGKKKVYDAVKNGPSIRQGCWKVHLLIAKAKSSTKCPRFRQV
ncbi:hypothetical protein NQ317_006711 [Molorchus minor]|uniref:Uncharacterized protein n=1 Tax=Molorchus minor TaxID=1323400 RepID=A0ABQ9K1C9_9CUCU|nr:hypothetical protein NQ317_006711 [Molorchus minor]